MKKSFIAFLFVAGLLLTPATSTSVRAAEATKSLNVLFIGNSYTARHNLATVVKSMAEAGQPGLDFKITQVIYGGRTPKDHWRLGTANFVNLYKLTEADVNKSISELEEFAKDPKDRYAKNALGKHKELLKQVGKPHPKWDIVVLQSYRDDVDGAKSAYVEYVPKFAELIHAQEARVILYETTPHTQNAEPLTEAPDPKPILEKERIIAKLANDVKADVAPMALIGLKCQQQRPDLTLRFINDAHLNKVMAYLTACALYAAIFDESPVGLPQDSITDIRFFNDKDRTKDRDGNPITRTFNAKDRADLQRLAWEGYQEMKQLRKQVK